LTSTTLEEKGGEVREGRRRKRREAGKREEVFAAMGRVE
jgi:hypothetical protein